VFSVPCIWGPKVVEQYFHREVARPHEDGVRVWVPGETFAPRYVCYRGRDDQRPPRASAELLTSEPPPQQRSRAASLQPAATAPRHQPEQRFARSSVHLAAQRQPINDPILRYIYMIFSFDLFIIRLIIIEDGEGGNLDFKFISSLKAKVFISLKPRNLHYIKLFVQSLFLTPWKLATTPNLNTKITPR
jgi:hypothetical protein